MNKLSLQLIFLAILFLNLSSCGKLSGSSTGANDQVAQNISVVGGVDSILVGKQRYLFSGSAGNAGNIGYNFELSFQLPEAEVVKFFFFSDSKLERGLELEFSNQSGQIFVKVDLNQKNHIFELTSLRGQTDINLSFDIHNDHTDVHALLWNLAGPYGDGDDCSFDESCLYNTEDFAHQHWLGVGRAGGLFWGMEGRAELILKVVGFRRTISNV